MPKMVSCPHCKAPIEDDTADLLAEAVKPLAEAIKGLPAQFPKPAELPSTLAETLAGVAQAGQHMEATATAWETQRKAEAEAQAHVSVPTSEDIEHFRTCPNCAPVWGKIWDNIAAEARKGYLPQPEVQEAMTEVVRQLTATKKGA